MAAVEPCKSFLGPFHLGIDQQDRIWVTNGAGGHVTRFPASDPSKVKKFSTGWAGSGLGIDSQGNVWVTNRFGSSIRGQLLIADLLARVVLGENPVPNRNVVAAELRKNNDQFIERFEHAALNN